MSVVPQGRHVCDLSVSVTCLYNLTIDTRMSTSTILLTAKIGDWQTQYVCDSSCLSFRVTDTCESCLYNLTIDKTLSISTSCWLPIAAANYRRKIGFWSRCACFSATVLLRQQLTFFYCNSELSFALLQSFLELSVDRFVHQQTTYAPSCPIASWWPTIYFRVDVRLLYLLWKELDTISKFFAQERASSGRVHGFASSQNRFEWHMHDRSRTADLDMALSSEQRKCILCQDLFT